MNRTILMAVSAVFFLAATVRSAAAGPLVSEAEFDRAVTSNGYPRPSAAQYHAFVSHATSAGSISSKRELAMFLTEVLWESGGLRYKKELACAHNNCSGSYRTGSEPRGKFYYGRGYLQLSWIYNYKAASHALYRDERLVQNPDQVANDENISWATAYWFWKANVHGDPGVHAGHFGSATNKINGALECHGGPNQDLAHKRFAIYKKVLVAFGDRERPNEGGCYN
jgi:predicted chitinase